MDATYNWMISCSGDMRRWMASRATWQNDVTMTMEKTRTPRGSRLERVSTRLAGCNAEANEGDDKEGVIMV